MAEKRKMICAFCGVAKWTTRKWHRFCGRKCHDEFHARNREILSITAAARELGVCRQTISKAIRVGAIRPVEIPTAGRPHRLITRGELERFRAKRNLS
jgi:hypothetical protein